MNTLLTEIKKGEHTFILAGKNQKVTSTERGIKPMFMAIMYNQELMNGADIADKVIGKAAALLASIGHPNAIYTPLASSDAVLVCKKYGIHLYAEKVVPFIQNRDKTGPCPMEAIAKDTEDPDLVKSRVEVFLIQNGLI